MVLDERSIVNTGKSGNGGTTVGGQRGDRRCYVTMPLIKRTHR
jgi:hypothetical protein